MAAEIGELDQHRNARRDQHLSLEIDFDQATIGIERAERALEAAPSGCQLNFTCEAIASPRKDFGALAADALAQQLDLVVIRVDQTPTA